MLKLVQYGGGIFSGNCPKCRRVVRVPKSLSVNAFMRDVATAVFGSCRKCGRVALRFLCFEK